MRIILNIASMDAVGIAAMKTSQNDFFFGIEAEYCLLDNSTLKPLFYEDLPCETLLNALDAIEVNDFSSEGFNIKPLHRKASPYLVEGYYLTDSQMKPYELLAKGIEVRTPLSRSIEGASVMLVELTERLRCRMLESGWALSSISHHPTRSNFKAARNYKRTDYWQWALTAMTTYGPDINISVPSMLIDEIDRNSLGEKINYYLPYVVALTFASPLLDGKLWISKDTVGKSIRTYKRSRWAPLFYVHSEPSLRFEFKGFEMPTNPDDYSALFLCGLTMLFDKSLTKRSSTSEAKSELKRLALTGLSSQEDRARAATVLTSALNTAARFGFDPDSLAILWQRLESSVCPADQIIYTFEENHGNLEQTMRSLMVHPRASHKERAQVKGASITYASEACAQLPPSAPTICS